MVSSSRFSIFPFCFVLHSEWQRTRSTEQAPQILLRNSIVASISIGLLYSYLIAFSFSCVCPGWCFALFLFSVFQFSFSSIFFLSFLKFFPVNWILKIFPYLLLLLLLSYVRQPNGLFSTFFLKYCSDMRSVFHLIQEFAFLSTRTFFLVPKQSYQLTAIMITKLHALTQAQSKNCIRLFFQLLLLLLLLLFWLVETVLSVNISGLSHSVTYSFQYVHIYSFPLLYRYIFLSHTIVWFIFVMCHNLSSLPFTLLSRRVKQTIRDAPQLY